MQREFTLSIDRRELATILAALRLHQDKNLRITSPDIPDQTIKDIATDCDSFKPLGFDEVGRLCEITGATMERITSLRPGSGSQANG